MPKEFSALASGGTGYVGVRSSNPDPKRRYHITISDDLCLGPDGLRDLALFFADFADETDPRDKATLIRAETPARTEDNPPKKSGRQPAPKSDEPAPANTKAAE